MSSLGPDDDEQLVFKTETTYIGRSAWEYGHAVSFTYPDRPNAADKQWYTAFFQSYGHVFPCGKCRPHWRKLLAKHPLTEKVLASRDSLARWFVDRHNDVNRRLGKPVQAYDDVKRQYIYYPHLSYANRKTGSLASSPTTLAPVSAPASTTATTPTTLMWVIGALMIGILLGATGSLFLRRRSPALRRQTTMNQRR